MFLFDHTQVADGLVKESLDRFVHGVRGPQIVHFSQVCSVVNATSTRVRALTSENCDDSHAWSFSIFVS